MPPLLLKLIFDRIGTAQGDAVLRQADRAAASRAR